MAIDFKDLFGIVRKETKAAPAQDHFAETAGRDTKVKPAEEYLKKPFNPDYSGQAKEILAQADAFIDRCVNKPGKKELRAEDVTDLTGPLVLDNGNILFGRYEQTIGKISPLEWIPLIVTYDGILMVTRKAIDAMAFDTYDNDWGKSDLRAWMNGKFLDAAFNEDEKAMIVPHEMQVCAYRLKSVISQKQTTDLVFALSLEEVEAFMRNDREKSAEPTEYAAGKGIYIRPGETTSNAWWLRNPGDSRELRTMTCDHQGFADDFGREVEDHTICVRPALYLRTSGSMEQAVLKKRALMRDNFAVYSDTIFRKKDLAEGIFQREYGELEEQDGEPKLLANGNILFGRYHLDSGEIGPLEWRVVERRDDKIFMICERILEQLSFCDQTGVMTQWRDCDLRKWLNNNFLNSAFTLKEQSIILPEKLRTPGVRQFKHSDDADTTDRIFLLSQQEAEYYLPYSLDRTVETEEDPLDEYAGSWWLRTTGEIVKTDRGAFNKVVYINESGDIDYRGEAPIEEIGVRPALCIKVTDWFKEEEKYDRFLDLFDNEGNLGVVSDTIKQAENAPLNDEDLSDLIHIRDDSYLMLFDLAGGRVLKSGNIVFGHYKTDESTVSRLTWIPVKQTEQGVIFVTTKAIDCKPMDSSSYSVNWADSGLRKWLNTEFIDLAFTEAEKQLLVNAPVKTAMGPECIETSDRVFLLSADEADQGFENDEDRIAVPTEYAKQRGADTSASHCLWWMRNQSVPYDFDTVALTGSVHVYRKDALNNTIGVRPAIVLKLNLTRSHPKKTDYRNQGADSRQTILTEPEEDLSAEADQAKEQMPDETNQPAAVPAENGEKDSLKAETTELQAKQITEPDHQEDRSAAGQTGQDLSEETGESDSLNAGAAETGDQEAKAADGETDPAESLSEIKGEVKSLQAEVAGLKAKMEQMRKELELLKAAVFPNSSDPLPTVTVSSPSEEKSAPKKDLITHLPEGNILFGRYPQGENGEIKPIEWQILDRKDNRILVISRDALDCRRYNETYTDITWENCTLRAWLNDTFINNAFSTDEKELIPCVTVSADGNPDFNSSPGNSTADQVFLLSINEVNTYFRNYKDRQCMPSEYAEEQGVYAVQDDGNCWWLLRTPGGYSYFAALVRNDGTVKTFGTAVDLDYAVRPALWIELKDTEENRDRHSEKLYGEPDPVETGEEKTIAHPEDAHKATFIKTLPDGNIEFGCYPQGENGETEPIEWQILDRKDNRILVISRYGLDCRRYNETYTDITWENCTLRAWLNDTFINNAFSTDEKELIPSVMVSADKNPRYYPSPGNNTIDKVFVLSINEADTYFKSDKERLCEPTEYAEVHGAYTVDDSKNCGWWLRAPGDKASSVANVYPDGSIMYAGLWAHYDKYAVRPALWINLES